MINEGSGGVASLGRDAIETAARRAARQAFGERAEVRVVAGEYEALVAAASAPDAPALVIVAGGDGTQAAIAGALLRTDKTHLPLPCGTVNELCRDLGVPLNLEEALASGFQGETAYIDVGMIGERVFLNNVVFGAYAGLAEAREELRKADNVEDISFGIVSAASALFHSEPSTYEVDIDGETVSLDTNTLAISNNAITSARNLIPHRNCLDAGELVLYLADAQHGGDFAAILAEFAVNGAGASERIQTLACKKCRISSANGELGYTIDGDPVETDQPVDFRIEPGALKVIRPRAKS